MVLDYFVLIEVWVFQLDIIIKKFQDQIMHLLKNGSGKHQKTQPKTKALYEYLEKSVQAMLLWGFEYSNPQFNWSRKKVCFFFPKNCCFTRYLKKRHLIDNFKEISSENHI